MQKQVVQSIFISACLLNTLPVIAATPVDLAGQTPHLLKTLVPTNLNGIAPTAGYNLRELSRQVDTRRVTHVRIQQTYLGYPVFGAQAVLHVPANGANRSLLMLAMQPTPDTKMNGIVYKNLAADLQNTPSTIFTKTQAAKAEAAAKTAAEQRYGANNIQTISNQLMILVDDQNKAHWAFQVKLRVASNVDGSARALPIYMLDAETLHIFPGYVWNNLQKAVLETVQGGGIGGNQKTGRLNFDGLPNNKAALTVMRDSAANTCYLQNEDVKVFSGNTAKKVLSYSCQSTDTNHNQVYWDAKLDEVNGGYAPAHDAMHAGTMVQNLYKQWLNVPMLKTADNKPMILPMLVHYGKQFENAEWDPDAKQVHLGDGKDDFYPLTSLGVVAHEVSHGFTSQHSDLNYREQSGAMNEAYSDMSAEAAKVFANGDTNWSIGSDIMKEKNVALRYLDRPSKDCQAGSEPGDSCSIDSFDQYAFLVKKANEYAGGNDDDAQDYIVHFASGVYNRAFYLLATSPGWDVKKAFTVMAEANANYWTSNVNFAQGACGVMQAAKALGDDTNAVAAAFRQVGIDTKCSQ